MSERHSVALITGASRGIGRASALALAEDRTDIAVIYAGNAQAAEQTCRDIESAGVKAKAYRCDVADFDACKQTVEAVCADFGTVDILVNNAGVTMDGLSMRMSEKQWDDCIAVNLKGAFNMIRHVSPVLFKKRAGRIINISSIAGVTGNAGQINYAAAKAGLIGMTKTVAREFASRGITCNAIAPGLIETDMTEKLPEIARAALLSGIPVGRAGKTEEVAALVRFLASEAAGYITGTVIAVDGGLSM